MINRNVLTGKRSVCFQPRSSPGIRAAANTNSFLPPRTTGMLDLPRTCCQIDMDLQHPLRVVERRMRALYARSANRPVHLSNVVETENRISRGREYVGQRMTDRDMRRFVRRRMTDRAIERT